MDSLKAHQILENNKNWVEADCSEDFFKAYKMASRALVMLGALEKTLTERANYYIADERPGLLLSAATIRSWIQSLEEDAEMLEEDEE